MLQYIVDVVAVRCCSTLLRYVNAVCCSTLLKYVDVVWCCSTSSQYGVAVRCCSMLMQNVVAVRCGIGKSFLMGSMSSMHTGQRAQPLNSKDGAKFREEDSQIGQSRCIAVKVEMKHYMYKG